ncbi:MAG TPA: hypothetical protein VGH74_01055, partial [Planctomycetaceae bacterium]
MREAVSRVWLPGLVAALLFLLSSEPVFAVDVLSSRNDDGRTGSNLQETILTPDNVRDDFGWLFSYDTKADVYAQPLFVSDLKLVSGRRANVVFVANVRNDVFAFDADGPPPGNDGVIWTRNLGPPETIGEALDTDGGGDGNTRKFGDVGILGTPVIDTTRQVLFLVSRQVERPKGGKKVFSQWLYALDLSTGADKAPPLKIEASGLSNPTDKDSEPIVFDPRLQNQRVGLALANGHVVVAWGSHEDQEAYRGWVISFDYQPGSLRRNGSFVTTPTGSTIGLLKLEGVCLWTGECAQGGIWQSGRAPAIDDKGRVLLFVGNGHNPRKPIGKNFDFGDSFVI